MSTSPGIEHQRLFPSSGSEFNFEEPLTSADFLTSHLRRPPNAGIRRKPLPGASSHPIYEELPEEPYVTSRSPLYHDNGRTSETKRPGFDTIKQWWLEIASLVLMLGTFFAIVGILIPYQSQPLPDWPFHLSINTIISILSTVLKTAALFILSEGLSHMKWQWFVESKPLQDLSWFDAASRGPWGCLILLLVPRGLHLVASLGAGLVVLSLAFDPFTQQLIRYYSCQQPDSSQNATLPRSNLYAEAGPHTSAGIWSPATPMLAFINQGLYNPVDVRAPFYCPGGNCTFNSQYSTLGFCASCRDRSADLTITNTTNSTHGQWINTTLPSGSYASYLGQGTLGESWFTVNTSSSSFDIILAATFMPGRTSSQRYFAHVFRGSETDPTGCATEFDNSTWACQGAGGSGAATCSLQPCVRTYNASVKQGKLHETLVSTHTDMFVGADASNLPIWLMADVGCAGADVRRQLQQAGFNITDGTTLVPWNVAIESTNGTASILYNGTVSQAGSVTIPGPLLSKTDLPLDIVPAKCIYQLYYYPYQSLTSFLTSYLNGALNPSVNTDAVYGPPQIRAIFNDSYVSFDSVNYTFQSIAEGITLRIRELGYPGTKPAAEPATGIVMNEVTCVDVRWGYLAFPGAFVGLITLFLAALIGQTVFAGKDSRIARGWKASPLPTVFHGLDVNFEKEDDPNLELIKGSSTSGSVRDMERIARRTHARLRSAGSDMDSIELKESR